MMQGEKLPVCELTPNRSLSSVTVSVSKCNCIGLLPQVA